MIILGLFDNHNAGVALLVDGEIIAVAEEERFTRVKMDTGFPKNAIDELRKEYPDLMNKIDYVAVGSTDLSFRDFATKRYPNFTVKDFLIEEKRYWYPKLQGENPDYLEVMSEYVDYDLSHYPLKSILNKKDPKELRVIRRDFISDYLNISSEKINFIDHHTAHAHHAYYSSPIREKTLIFTMDGWGDNTNATVSIEDNGDLRCLYRTNDFNVGRIYHFVTLLLGMMPAQHEYKVMGLAAYAKEHYIVEPLKVFQKILCVEGLEVKKLVDIENHYQYFKTELEGYRFDAIAGALQSFSEDIMVQWVSNWIEHTGISTVVMSGGVSLNIKASKKISELKNLSKLHISPGAGDESICIGAAQVEWKKHNDSNFLKPISSPYLGLGYNQIDVDLMINHPFVKDNYNCKRDVTKIEIAQLLAQGEIIMYMQGRMEFGPRALGHRSILASPQDASVVQKINTIIKNRDFWMPFTPSILAEKSDEYLINPKKISADYMTMAFDSTDKAKKDLVAAIHQTDSTLRAQLVSKEFSPLYHEVLTEFYKITGIAGLLNTSLNIHGKPIVHKPIDIVNEILTNKIVKMDYIVVDNILFSSKKP